MNGKRMRTAAILLTGLLLSFAPASRGWSLEVGGLFSIGNLVFDQNRASTDTSFSGASFPWGITLYADQRLSENLSLEGGFYYDPILRNLARALVSYHDSYLSVGVGPAFGYLNSTTDLLRGGITASFRLELPGIAYFSYDMDSTIGGELVLTGDYLQERNDLSIGYYIPNAICSLNLLSRRYVEKTDAGNTVDNFTEYSFKTDLFQKNVPYRVVLSFAYQTLSKTFANGGTTTTDTLGSLVVGTRFEAAIGASVTYILDVDSSVYTFGQDALVGLSNPGPSWLGGYLFRASTGVKINVDRLLHPNG